MSLRNEPILQTHVGARVRHRVAIMGVALASVGAPLLLTSCAQDSHDQHSISDPATQAYLRAQASVLAEEMGISEPPTIEPVRLVNLTEWAETQVACLTEKGFTVALTEDGEGISYPELADAALADQLLIARYTCQVEYPVSPLYTAPLSEDQLQRLFSYRTSELVKCLEDRGYPPEESAPSQQVFFESGGAWSPYESASIPSNEIANLSRECPQIPADLYD